MRVREALEQGFGVVTSIEVWYRIEMARPAITRNQKRLDLRVSRLDALVRKGEE